MDPEALILGSITVALVFGAIHLYRRFAFKTPDALATTKISLDRSGVIRIYSISPLSSINAPVLASGLTPAPRAEVSNEDLAEVCVVQTPAHYPNGIGSVVGWLVILEIAKWIWWL